MGAPYIYDISHLRVNSLKNHGNIISPLLSMAVKFFKIRGKSRMEIF